MVREADALRTDRASRLLLVTLEATSLRPTPTCCQRSALGSWRGLGAVEHGMAHQGYDLPAHGTPSGTGGRRCYTTGMEHSPTSATGTAWERTPWHATQRAAWEALTRTQ